MPLHAHEVAKDICENGTSKRRDGQVRLVLVPDAEKETWLSGVGKKVELNPLLAKFQAISHDRPLYATLSCTHFVEAQKIINEGGRWYRDIADGLRLQHLEANEEGLTIQAQGVTAIV